VGVVAAALLLAGGLQALQTASIVAALPFSVVMLVMAAALFRSLAQESDEPTR
jgi:choline-glycine betaine transporter